MYVLVLGIQLFLCINRDIDIIYMESMCLVLINISRNIIDVFYVSFKCLRKDNWYVWAAEKKSKANYMSQVMVTVMLCYYRNSLIEQSAVVALGTDQFPRKPFCKEFKVTSFSFIYLLK